MRHTIFALVLLTGTGCWARMERQQLSRLDTMDGHLLAAVDTVAAVERRDIEAFEASLRSLEKGGAMPGADVDAQLDLFHRSAKDVRGASDWPARAEGTTRLLDQCGACHTTRGVGKGGLVEPEGPVESAVWALVWRDDVLWRQSGLSGGSWESRRAALQKKLLEQEQ